MSSKNKHTPKQKCNDKFTLTVRVNLFKFLNRHQSHIREYDPDK